MFTTVIAVLCTLSSGMCVEEIVTDSNMDPSLTFQGCQIMGQIGIADWISKHPIYHAHWRLESWKCAPGKYEIKGRV